MGDIYLVGAYVGLSEELACLNNFMRGVVALKQIMHCEQLPKLIHQLSLNYGIISCLLRREEQGEFHNQSHSPGLEAYYEMSDCRGGKLDRESFCTNYLALQSKIAALLTCVEIVYIDIELWYCLLYKRVRRMRRKDRGGARLLSTMLWQLRLRTYKCRAL